MPPDLPSVRLRSEDTDGVVSLVALSSGAGSAGPPLHRHDVDEAFYVLEGALTFRLGEELFTRGLRALLRAHGGRARRPESI